MTSSVLASSLPLALAPNPEASGGNPLMGLLPLLMVIFSWLRSHTTPTQRLQ